MYLLRKNRHTIFGRKVEFMEKAKKRFALKTKEAPITEEQQRSVDNLYKLTGLKRKE